MKKIVMSVIIIFFTLACISCKNDLTYLVNEGSAVNKFDENFEYTECDDKPIGYNVISGGDFLQFSNGYLYFYEGISDYVNGSSNTFMRYNVKTGAVSFVCQDPLCTHDSLDCPFFGMTLGYHLTNDKVCFTRISMKPNYEAGGTVDFWGGFVSYDLKTAKLKVHSQFDDLVKSGGYIYQLYVDNYRFFYDEVYDEKTGEWKTTLLTRMNLKTNEILRLSEDNVFDKDSFQSSTHGFSTQFLFALDGRIYMTDTKTIYSTDYAMKNKKIHATGNFAFGAKTDGKYIYYGVKSDTNNSRLLQNVHRMNFDGTGDIDLGFVAVQFQITDKYIYYKVPDDTTIGKYKGAGYGLSEITLFGSEIRRCGHDGTNNESVFKFESDTECYRFNGDPIIVGNYIYGVYECWKDSNGDGIFGDGDNYSSNNVGDYNIMRINIETGEIYYIKVD